MSNKPSGTAQKRQGYDFLVDVGGVEDPSSKAVQDERTPHFYDLSPTHSEYLQLLLLHSDGFSSPCGPEGRLDAKLVTGFLTSLLTLFGTSALLS